jgi:hypothetical protein
MTDEFDALYESIINEFQHAKSKRHESRYWADGAFPGLQPRKVSNKNNRSSSQATKLGNQQYIGNPLGANGVRGRNESEKDVENAGIAKGLGGHLRVQGVNPKKIGASINSKQGDMVVKQVLANGVVKVGSRGKVDYKDGMIKRRHLAQFNKKFAESTITHFNPDSLPLYKLLLNEFEQIVVRDSPTESIAENFMNIVMPVINILKENGEAVTYEEVDGTFFIHRPAK